MYLDLNRSTISGPVIIELVEPTYSANAPQRVRQPVMQMSWEQLTFLHWSYDPAVVQALLPKGLTVHTFDGRAWVGLIPFHMVVAPPKVPPVPWLSRFPETNVRSYVKDTTGRTGIWFFSLEADRLAAVVAARLSYRLPYFWNVMSIVEASADSIAYRSKRKWPGPRGASLDAHICIGEAIEPGDVTSFEHFLTARWTLFSAHKRGLHYANAFHEPWPLQRATVERLDQSLFEAAGFPSPMGDPVAHYSPNVDVTIGPPHRVS